ncbi:MAG: DUF72 domain-containing protein [Thermoanaerobaculia bacterium]
MGLCGFTIGAAEYPRHFDLVEVQQTFYEPPRTLTLSRWRAAMPPGFEFTLKAWQLITHQASSRTYRRLRTPLSPGEAEECGAFRWTPVVRRAWTRTLECARLLHATAVLFQCPASFRPTEENLDNLRRFFRETGPTPGLRYLWEPRGEWETALVESICRELDLTHVVDPFQARHAWPRDFVYYRLHGVSGARHVYTDDELRKLAAMLPGQGTAYVLFNNLPRFRDARRFRRLIGPAPAS